MQIRLPVGQSVWVPAFSVFRGLLGLSSQAADNPLLGTWKWDNDKTLAPLGRRRQASARVRCKAPNADTGRATPWRAPTYGSVGWAPNEAGTAQ
jgi:hypothetical protein